MAMNRKTDKILKLKQPVRLSEQMAGHLKNDIQSGKYKSGEKLPSEAVLAESFGVSRTVVREALARLKYDGLIDSRQGAGVEVAAVENVRSFRLDGLESASDNDFTYFYELRTILESDAAFLAAVRRSDADVNKLKNCLDLLNESIQKNTDGVEADFEFHRIIAMASGNPVLSDLMQFLNARLRTIIRKARVNSSRKPGLPLKVQEEHVAIYEAIAARDSEKSRKAMTKHIRKSGNRLGFKIPNDL